MSIEQIVMLKVKALPDEKKKEVLDFVEFSHLRTPEKRPLRNLRGLWAGFNTDISEADIREVRAEMWQGFPREDI